MGKDASKEVTSSVEAFETRTRSPEEIGDDSIRARKGLMKWFLVGARNLLKGVNPLNQRDRQFVVRRHKDFDIISYSQASDEERKKVLLKRGRAGFLGGVIIRHLLKWNEQKKQKSRRPRTPKSVVVVPNRTVSLGHLADPSPLLDRPELVDPPKLPAPKLKGPNVKYTKRKQPAAKKSPPKKKKKYPKKKFL